MRLAAIFGVEGVGGPARVSSEVQQDSRAELSPSHPPIPSPTQPPPQQTIATSHSYSAGCQLQAFCHQPLPAAQPCGPLGCFNGLAAFLQQVGPLLWHNAREGAVPSTPTLLLLTHTASLAPLPLLSPGVTTQRRPRYAAVVRAQAASLAVSPGRWLGPQTAAPPAAAEEQQQGPPVYGCELTAEQWDPLNLSQTMLKVRKVGAKGQRLPFISLHVLLQSPRPARSHIARSKHNLLCAG